MPDELIRKRLGLRYRLSAGLGAELLRLLRDLLVPDLPGLQLFGDMLRHLGSFAFSAIFRI